jgi:diacylglycerol O-acyltransferase
LTPRTNDLGRPFWVDDDRFDIRYHIRRTALPAPGDDEALCQLVARVMSQRLDRDRPLWECWVVEGLPGGRWAVVSKVHHCMADGIAGRQLHDLFFDHGPVPEAPVEAVEGRAAAEPPSNLRLTAEVVRDLALSPVEQFRHRPRPPARRVRLHPSRQTGIPPMGASYTTAVSAPRQ